MPGLIIEDGREKRRHRKRLASCFAESSGIVRVATAYVTDRQLLGEVTGRRIRLLTTLNVMDVASGATSLESLRALLDIDVECRELPEHPRLHAKVYVFGMDSAVVTSANLTFKGLDSNIEVGRETSADEAQQLAKWFDGLWAAATLVTHKRLAELQKSTAGLRRRYVELKREIQKKAKPESGRPRSSERVDSIETAFANAARFFVCNTDRRYAGRTATGGYVLEEAMRSRGFAAGWEEFKFVAHMDRAEPGDVIFMFAKAVGIVGLGVVTGRVERLSRRQAGKINDSNVESRIPMLWLDWRDDADAYAWKSPNFTFWEITEPQYEGFRAMVKAHFLRDS